MFQSFWKSRIFKLHLVDVEYSVVRSDFRIQFQELKKKPGHSLKVGIPGTTSHLVGDQNATEAMQKQTFPLYLYYKKFLKLPMIELFPPFHPFPAPDPLSPQHLLPEKLSQRQEPDDPATPAERTPVVPPPADPGAVGGPPWWGCLKPITEMECKLIQAPWCCSFEDTQVMFYCILDASIRTSWHFEAIGFYELYT